MIQEKLAEDTISRTTALGECDASGGKGAKQKSMKGQKAERHKREAVLNAELGKRILLVQIASAGGGGGGGGGGRGGR